MDRTVALRAAGVISISGLVAAAFGAGAYPAFAGAALAICATMVGIKAVTSAPQRYLVPARVRSRRPG